MDNSIENRNNTSNNVEENPWQKMADEVLAENSSRAGENREKKESKEADDSFVELLDEDIFEKIAIDEGLKPSFKRVLAGVQSYFNANGYSENKDYRQLLNDSLVEDSDEKMPIRYADLGDGVSGCYSRNGNFKNQCIKIDKKTSDTKTDAENDHTLCHEFIHFLAMRGNRDEEFADKDIVGGGFVNEALTESLARQIFPSEGMSYEPQVRMLDFANLMTGQKNNYKLFLANGMVDAAQRISYWINFSAIANRYWEKTKKNPRLDFDMSSAEKDEDYLAAQRFLIDQTIPVYRLRNLSDYTEALEKIQSRPAKDEAWTEDFMAKMDKALARQLCGNGSEASRGYAMALLKEFRDTYDKLQEYDGRDVYEFKEGDITVVVDAEGEVECSGPWKQYSTRRSPEGIQSIGVTTKTGEEHTFPVGELTEEDFKKRRQDLLRKREQLSDFLSGDVHGDFKAIENMPENTQKLESFTIPIIPNSGMKTKFQTIHIATAEDGSTSFSGEDYREIGEATDVYQMQFVGYNAGPDHSLYGNSMPPIQNGKVFSCLSERRIQSDSIREITRQYVESNTEEQLDKLFEQFKQTSDYDAEAEDMSKEDWIYFAVRKYVEDNYQDLDGPYRRSIEEKIIESSPKFVVAKDNGKVTVASFYGVSALSYKNQVLYDKSTDAPLNGYLN